MNIRMRLITSPIDLLPRVVDTPRGRPTNAKAMQANGSARRRWNSVLSSYVAVPARMRCQRSRVEVSLTGEVCGPVGLAGSGSDMVVEVKDSESSYLWDDAVLSVCEFPFRSVTWYGWSPSTSDGIPVDANMIFSSSGF